MIRSFPRYAVISIALVGSGACSSPPKVPPQQTNKRISAANGLTDAQRKEFYTLSEGSELFPLSWFLLLESNATGKPFTEDLERFGLIFAPQTTNEYNLPIGLTVHTSPDLRLQMLGVNCAACHVGEIRYGNDKPWVQIDGAPNMFDIQLFYNELLGSAAATLRSPSKLIRLLLGRSPAHHLAPDMLAGALARENHPDADEVESFLEAQPRASDLVDTMHDSFADLDALRADGEDGAALAAEVETIMKAEAEDFEDDFRAHGHALVTSILLGQPEPERAIPDPPPYQADALHLSLDRLTAMSSDNKGDGPRSRAALAQPELATG